MSTVGASIHQTIPADLKERPQGRIQMQKRLNAKPQTKSQKSQVPSIQPNKQELHRPHLFKGSWGVGAGKACILNSKPEL